MIYAVVLAAGASSRYGSSPPKQVELLPRVLDALLQSKVDKIVVVSGAHPLDVESVHCPDWERGPGASLRCGLAALPDEAEAALVVLADGPELDPRAIDRLASQIIDPLRGIELELSRNLQLLLSKENIRSAQEDEIPQGYQKLVEEYYKKLSNPKQQQ